MKRQLLLGIYAIAAIAVSAQSVKMNFSPINKTERIEKTEIKKAGKMNFDIENRISSSLDQKIQVKEIQNRVLPSTNSMVTPRAEGVEAAYLLPMNDTFHFGMNKSWDIKYPNIILPPAVDVVFLNLSSPDEATCTWSLQGQTPSEALGEEYDSFFKVLPTGSFSTNWPALLMDRQYGYNLSPIVTATLGSASDSYFYSKGAVYGTAAIPIEKKSITFPAGGFNELTTSDPIMGKVYTGYSRKLSSGVIENIQFGSGAKNSKGENCTGIMSIYNKPAAPLVIESVSIHAKPNTAKDANAVSINDLTLKVYKINGATVTNEVLAEAECTAAEYITESGAYYITFQFVKDEGLLGTQPTPFTLNQKAAFEIDGFDKCDITVFVTDNESLINGHAYGVYPSGLNYVSYDWFNQTTTGMDFNIADFMMNLNANYVTLTSGGEEYSLTAPTAGGIAVKEQFNAFQIFSTFPVTDPNTEEDNVYIADAPDWITKIVIDDKWGKKDEKGNEFGCYFLFQVTCAALPTGTTGRQGDIVFETIGGIQTKVHVTQGTVTGIETIETSPVSAISIGNNFELSYPQNVTNVTVNNIAGQTLATYKLPTGGKYTIPATSLSKGMYILRFNNNQTVKVMK